MAERRADHAAVEESDMADIINSEPRRRGRPKGTGIDDSDTLRRINSLLSENTKLKPTTAIKICLLYTSDAADE